MAELNNSLAFIKNFIGRELTPVEILICGMAYQHGYSDGLKYEKKEDEES